MKQIVAIATSPGREHWVSNCLKSIGHIPYIVVSDYGYELGKIQWMYDNTNFDRWLLLQDSVSIKDARFFDMAFSYPKSVAVSNCPVKFGMYLGVYCRETLDKVGIPTAFTKEDAIHYERHWSDEYCATEGDVPTMFEDFKDQNATGIREMFGRDNLILENEYIIKYKGTWAY